MSVGTRINWDRYKLSWSIENFSLFSCAEGDDLKSPPFKTGAITWSLQLYPAGMNLYSKDVVLHVRNVLPGDKHDARFTCYFLEGNNVPWNQQHSLNLIGIRTCHWNYNISQNDFMERKGALLKNDTLTLVCEVKVKTSAPALQSLLKTTKEDTEVDVQPRDLQSLSCDFRTLYESGRFSDFLLKADNKEVPAHRAVLAARSPVFAAMLEHDTLEKNKGCVDISDVPLDVLESMLMYMYSGNLEDLTLERAVGLYDAAEKYLLPDLTAKCHHYLLSNYSVGNVCEMALLADRHNNAELKKKTKRCILYNACEVLKTESWKQLSREKPSLASELLQAVAATFTG